jgi:hypothetical protein
MDAPDYSKYDKNQLKQILTRIDRERFPERVRDIEARLNSFDREPWLGNSKGTGDNLLLDNGVVNVKNRVTVRWLIAGALLIALAAGAFTVSRTIAAREKWFEHQAKMENFGVEADAIIIGKLCSAKSVTYSWKWNGKEFQGNGWSCNSVCSQAKTGDQARIRFLPTNPEDVRCVPNDVETKIGPPNYFDPLLLVIFFVAIIFVPFLRLLRKQ